MRSLASRTVHRIALYLLCASMFSGAPLRATPSLLGEQHQEAALLTDLLNIWSLINTARSIARQDALAFHDSIFSLLLEAFIKIDTISTYTPEISVDITIVDQALYGLSNSHAALYKHITYQEFLGSSKLIEKINSRWSSYKDRASYSREQSGLLSPDLHQFS